MDDETFRRGIAGSVVMLLIGAVGLALGTWPALLAGWAALLFGLAGLGAYLGDRFGWFAGRRRSAGPATAAEAPVREPDEPVPQLSEPGQAQVARIVADLHTAGVFAPEAPDPAHLYEPVADYGEPVTIDAVLMALYEASYYHPGFRPESCMANLVCHGTQVEQFEGHLREQIDDLVRLAGGALTVAVIDIEQDRTDGSRRVPTRIRWIVDGSEGALAYAGASKNLSTVIHVTLARALSGAPRRLAALWDDQGMWITALPGGADLSALPGDWEWLDGQEPLAAGDMR